MPFINIYVNDQQTKLLRIIYGIVMSQTIYQKEPDQNSPNLFQSVTIRSGHNYNYWVDARGRVYAIIV